MTDKKKMDLGITRLDDMLVDHSVQAEIPSAKKT